MLPEYLVALPKARLGLGYSASQVMDDVVARHPQAELLRCLYYELLDYSRPVPQFLTMAGEYEGWFEDLNGYRDLLYSPAV